MDRRVEFQSRVTTRDNYGQVGPGYSTTATVWADVIDRGSPREKNMDASVFSMAAKIAIIRDPRGSWTLSETMRAVIDGENFDVVGFHDIGRHEGFRVFLERVRD